MIAALTGKVIAEGGQSPAEVKIAAAKKAVEADPNRYESYNELATALTRRARETGDPNYYIEAEKALENSFELSPGNFEGEKIRAWILLGQHKFPQALGLATRLNQRMPDDVIVYGFLTDANIELGNYDAAEKAAQWMLDLRPGNIPAYTRAAYLRELFGDVEGAIELMQSAYQRTAPAELEDRAWILTQLAHLNIISGKTDVAEKLLETALQLFPRYHYALANLARVRTAQKRNAEAIELLRELHRLAPHPENLYLLAKALRQSGYEREANMAFAEFEEQSLHESEETDNANRELIFFYVDHAKRPEEALRIARREIGWRRDLQTREAYAWALCANREYTEAQKQMQEALKVGYREANFLYHAGVIFARAGDHTLAEQYLRESLKLEPRSEVSEAVNRELSHMAWTWRVSTFMVIMIVMGLVLAAGWWLRRVRRDRLSAALQPSHFATKSEDQNTELN